MDAAVRQSAERTHARLQARGPHDPSRFRAELLAVPPDQRDAWVDAVLGLGALPADGPELPEGGVPYLPCPVDALLRLVDHATVTPADVFVDIGSGVGRAAALVHLFTGVEAIGIEVQRGLIAAARDLGARFPGARLSWLEGDAAELAGRIVTGTVFFLYCPFSGARLAKVLAGLEVLARARPLRLGCVDLPLPRVDWLEPLAEGSGGLTVFRSRSADPTRAKFG